MKKKITKLPQIARPNINEVLEEFLEEQRRRLQPRTSSKYESVIDLLTSHLDGYAHQTLDKGESALFEKLFNEKEMNFCDIFGPEKILPNTGGFLSWFMIRKVICSRELLRMSGTVVKKLAKWIEEKGYATDQEAEAVVEEGAIASKELPAADELASLLYMWALNNTPANWTDELEDYFEVERVEPGKLWLSSFGGEDKVGPIPVSEAISGRCKVGWQIFLVLVKTPKGWRILETGNVYPL